MKRLWIIEIWQEDREVYKSLLGHMFSFVMLIGILLSIDYLISMSSLHEEKKLIIAKIDFYGIVLALAILTLTCLCQLSVISIKKIRDIFHD